MQAVGGEVDKAGAGVGVDVAYQPVASGVLGDTVVGLKSIRYIDTSDHQKHQLNLWVPERLIGQTKESCPIVVFIHGGGWRRGDREWHGDCYNNLARHIARHRILCVVPSYRLAPRHVHPAQVEDVLACIRWTLANAVRYGGDASCVFLMGHSAGAHLISLLSLDTAYAQKHGVDLSVIRGVIPVSGVYDIDMMNRWTGVKLLYGAAWGKDKNTWINGSPVTHVQRTAFPWLLINAKYDYWLLLRMAREFSDVMWRAGNDINGPIILPRQSHSRIIGAGIGFGRPSDRMMQISISWIMKLAQAYNDSYVFPASYIQYDPSFGRSTRRMSFCLRFLLVLILSILLALVIRAAVVA